MFIKIINKLEESIICLLLVTMTLMVFIEVILRFCFNTGLMWVGEATLYTAAWFVLFGASYGIKVGAHIGVDAFVKLLPNTPRKIAAIIAVLLCLFYCGLFLYGGWIYLSKMKMIGIEMDDMPIPKWIAMSILFIGFVLLVIRFLTLLWNIITNKQQGFHIVDEAQESMHLAQELEETLRKEQLAASQGSHKQ
ncbi:MAG: TRAP transporter small permease [Hahellaceae bacterium]|jgi:C4-dicarboxylate transporter DctQ subunit|nr:TRAP transporter small permease [Hahellaceae bacterium]MCP5209736.1 TRAP transporter small permease [Hahellaceae bacterium]